jgi:hypothetical protein
VGRRSTCAHITVLCPVHDDDVCVRVMHEQEKIDMDAFQMLNDQDLQVLGVAQMGIRKKVNTALSC